MPPKWPKPFLLYLPLPHRTRRWHRWTEWKDKSGLNIYADFVMQTDATVGRVLDALEKSGVADNTLVIFTSDNGCATYIGANELEQKGHYPSGPLRGYKSDAWEGGHREPFIVRWPGTVKPGSVCRQLVEQTDIFRTLADILGRNCRTTRARTVSACCRCCMGRTNRSVKMPSARPSAACPR